MKKSILAVGLLCATSSFGEVNWSGFMNVGIRYAGSDKGYRAADYKQTNFRSNSNLGLNINAEISDSSFTAAQLVARLSDTTPTIQADWAFLNYDLGYNLTFRTGRIKNPTLFASEYIDFGFVQPWSSTPKIYNLYQIKSIDGASLSYELPLGPVATSFDLWLGSLSLTTEGSTGTLAIDAKNISGFQLRLMYDAFEFRASQMTANWAIESVTDKLPYELTTFGFKGDVADVFFQAEHFILKNTDKSDFEALAEGYESQLATVNAGIEAATAAGQSTDTLTTTATALSSAIALNRAFAATTNATNLTVGYRVSEMIAPYLMYENMDAGDGYAFVGDINNTSIAIGASIGLSESSKVKFQARQTKIDGERFAFVTEYPVTGSSVYDSDTTDETSMDYQVTFNTLF